MTDLQNTLANNTLETLSNNLLEVIIVDRLKCNQLETRNTKWQLVISDDWWQVDVQQT
jgi:hypothetical protein